MKKDTSIDHEGMVTNSMIHDIVVCNKLTPFEEHGQQHHEECSSGHEQHLGYPYLHKTKNLNNYIKVASTNIEININSMTYEKFIREFLVFRCSKLKYMPTTEESKDKLYSFTNPT